MVVSTEQLRIQPERIISEVNRGQEITITYQGKPSAKIIPISSGEKGKAAEAEGELFGIWKNRKDMGDVEHYVRDMRKGRKV